MYGSKASNSINLIVRPYPIVASGVYFGCFFIQLLSKQGHEQNLPSSELVIRPASFNEIKYIQEMAAETRPNVGITNISKPIKNVSF